MEKFLGNKYNRLTVIGEVEKQSRKRYLKCVCDCGQQTVVRSDKLKSGHTKSCGCLQRERVRDALSKTKTHGMTNSGEYYIWCGMKSRCFNENNKSYKYYGGRGITVCDRWRDSFENFYEDMGPRPSSIHQIDRINNDGNYEPGNCKWRTPSENCLNRRCKLGKTGIKNITKDGISYVTVVTRRGYTRRSFYRSLNHAKKMKKIYIEEYNKNPQKWIEDTVNKTYLR